MGNKSFKMARGTIALLMVSILGLFIFSAVLDDRKWVVDTFCATEGAMDLERWNAKESIVKLDGEWLFYWSQFSDDISRDNGHGLNVNVPRSWEDMVETDFESTGYGSYRLKVTGLIPNGSYGLKMLDQVTAYRLEINDELVAYNGKIGRARGESKPEWRPVLTRFSADQNGEADFEMEISNFDYSRGGFWNSIYIGNESLISRYSNMRTVSETFLFAGLFVMAAFFMGMHAMYPSEKDTLIFSLFCLMMSIQISFTGERIIQDFLPQISWGLSLRIEYMSGYLLLPLFGLYVSHRFHRVVLEKSKRFFSYLGLALCLAVILLPHSVYASLIDPLKYLTIAAAPYFAYVFYRVCKEGQSGAQLSIVAFLILFMALLKDTFYKSEFSALPYGAFIFMIVFSLITISKYVWVRKTNEILENQIIRDPLTGTFNRAYLDTFIKCQIEEAYFVLFLDLDHFKKVNDSFGHDVGDEVLKEVSHRIRRQVRSADIVCRYGGDEFVILVLDGPDVNVDQIAERIVQALNEPMSSDLKEAQIGVSIGISHYPNDGDDLNDLIRRSDLEMYRIKLSGGNGHHRHSSLKAL